MTNLVTHRPIFGVNECCAVIQFFVSFCTITTAAAAATAQKRNCLKQQLFILQLNSIHTFTQTQFRHIYLFPFNYQPFTLVCVRLCVSLSTSVCVCVHICKCTIAFTHFKSLPGNLNSFTNYISVSECKSAEEKFPIQMNRRAGNTMNQLNLCLPSSGKKEDDDEETR